MLHVAEVLRHGQAGQADAHTDAGRLVHLSEDQSGHIGDAAGLHLVPEVITLTAALADAGEDRVGRVLHTHVMDQLLDQNGLTDTCAAEEADLTALRVRLQQVDDLDTGLEDLDRGTLVLELRRFPMNDPALIIRGNRRTAVDGLTQHVKHAAERGLADRNTDAVSGVDHVKSTLQAVALRQHNAADHAVALVVGYFHRESLTLHVHGQRLPDRRRGTVFELDVHDGTRDSDDLSGICHGDSS